MMSMHNRECFPKASMKETREAFGLVKFEQSLYVFGGYTDENYTRGLRSAETYEIASDTWTMIPSMPKGGRFVSAVVVKNQIFITSASFTLMSFKPLTQAYHELELSCPNRRKSLVVADKRIILFLRHSIH